MTCPPEHPSTGRCVACGLRPRDFASQLCVWCRGEHEIGFPRKLLGVTSAALAFLLLLAVTA